MSDAITGIAGYPKDFFSTVNPYCLDGILRLSDEMPVMASCDILDGQGVLLWAKGKPVSRILQERVGLRRLQKPLELSLDIAEGLSLKGVVSDCLDLVSMNPALEALAVESVVRNALRETGSYPLPASLKLLLTLAREHRRHIYDHSLATAVICSGLAKDIGLDDSDTRLLILSALVHDIGEIYINPEYLDNKRQLQPEEWKHVAWHPRIGEAFLKAFTEFPLSVAASVLHHHERMDGSGYPFQHTEENISPLGKLLGVADSVSAIALRNPPGLGERVALALSIVPEEFPPAAVSSISRSLAQLDSTGTPLAYGSFSERVLPALQRLRSARLLAEAIASAATSQPVARAGQFALKTIRAIDGHLHTAGLYDLSRLDVLDKDPACMGKVCLILGEANWRLRNLARTIHLRVEQEGSAPELAQIAPLVSALTPPWTSGD